MAGTQTPNVNPGRRIWTRLPQLVGRAEATRANARVRVANPGAGHWTRQVAPGLHDGTAPLHRVSASRGGRAGGEGGRHAAAHARPAPGGVCRTCHKVPCRHLKRLAALPVHNLLVARTHATRICQDARVANEEIRWRRSATPAPSPDAPCGTGQGARQRGGAGARRPEGTP